VLVRYGSEDLERLAADGHCGPVTWDADVIQSYLRRHQSLVAAQNREDLCALQCLDLRTENGQNGARASIRLLDDARLLLDFDGAMSNKVTVVGIVVSDTREVAR
jgi:plasmid maintenance system killer protein